LVAALEPSVTAATVAGLEAKQDTGERCLRCGAAMEWRHQTWQCSRCRFKLGCCEGEPQSCSQETRALAKPARAPNGSASAASETNRR
jgi:hypothetical protein